MDILEESISIAIAGNTQLKQNGNIVELKKIVDEAPPVDHELCDIPGS